MSSILLRQTATPSPDPHARRFSWDYIFDWTLKRAQQVAGLRSVYGTTSKLIHYSSKLQEADGSRDAQDGANSGNLESSYNKIECL